MAFLNQNRESLFSFCISDAIQKEKSEYYRAFKETRDQRNHDDLDTFILPFASILIDDIQSRISALKEKQKKAEDISQQYQEETSSDRLIFRVLAEASQFTYFGVSNEEIMSTAQVSKRTLMYFLRKYRDRVETQSFGRYNYHRLKL